MSKMKNFLIAFAWCWVSAFISLLIMADKGSLDVEKLHTYVIMAGVGVFLGPLFLLQDCLDAVVPRWCIRLH